MSSYEERKQRKEWYLDECSKTTYEESTIELLKKIFQSLELEERAFDKDVSEFTDLEAIDYLKSLNSTSRIRLSNVSWLLSRYHQWCYDKGLVQSIVDPFDERTITKAIEDIIPDELVSSKIITEDAFRELVELEPDYVNKFMLICFYYGIKGDDYVEMKNIKMSDLDKENKTVDLITGRKAFVDDYFIEHMQKAYHTENYITYTINKGINHKQTVYKKSEYVVRPTAGIGDEYTDIAVTTTFIQRRMGEIRNNVGNQHFTITNLYFNGLINYIKKKYNEKGISLKTAFFQLNSSNRYKYEQEIKSYVDEFGATTRTVRSIRMNIKDFIEKY